MLSKKSKPICIKLITTVYHMLDFNELRFGRRRNGLAIKSIHSNTTAHFRTQIEEAFGRLKYIRKPLVGLKFAKV